MTMRLAMRQERDQNRQMQEAIPYIMPAPIGGLNARDALAAMPETDAIVCDNWFPQPSWLELRGGYSVLAKTVLSAITGQCQTLMAYNALSGTNLLFAGVSFPSGGTSAGIFRVDNAAGGNLPSASVTLSSQNSARLDWAQFGTGALEVLITVNGIDAPQLFDGTTWTAVTASAGTYNWTSGPSPLSSLSAIAVYKQRMWFIQSGTMNVYYLPQNVVQGAMTLLPIGPNFKLGGFLVSMITVSIDDAAGTQDYIGFLSNQGELVIFQGYDPSSASTWSLAGHIRMGYPIGTGRRCWVKLGMDAAVICNDGLTPISAEMLTDRSEGNIAISDKIRYQFNADAIAYGSNFGWQALLCPVTTKIVVNVPTNAAGTSSYCYVQNTIKKAWCTFGKYNSPWNATCFEVMGNGLYFGNNGIVAQCDVPLIGDNGGPITAVAQNAFSGLKKPEIIKQFVLSQPIFQNQGVVNITTNIITDFQNANNSPAIMPSVGGGTLWGAPWGSSWGIANLTFQPFAGLASQGNYVSTQVALSGYGIQAKWATQKYLYKPGAAFYG